MGGQNKITLTDKHLEYIEQTAGLLNMEQIAWMLDMGESTLQKKLREDERAQKAYKKGRSNRVRQVANTLYLRAIQGDITAMIFYLKTQGRWREVHRVETETHSTVDVYHHSPVNDLRERLARISARN